MEIEPPKLCLKSTSIALPNEEDNMNGVILIILTEKMTISLSRVDVALHLKSI